MRNSNGQFSKGHTGFRKRKGYYIQCKICGKEVYAKPKYKNRQFCGSVCKVISQKGRKLSEEHKDKLRIASINAGCNPPHKKGKEHYNWQGGITKEVMRIRNSLEMKNWRISVWERDNYICQKCGKRGGKLHAHHVKSFSQYPELRFELNNGQTLCVPCHKLTDNYLNKALAPKKINTQAPWRNK